ncbi:MAG TPA: hypothetical protein VFF79_04350 [Conexibacter sp.]|jgi:hypothetical protein|nr:hypothetical protein [Conexibacter sp.]
MARRAALILALIALIAVAGCAYGTAARLTPAQERARIQFVKDHGKLNDRDLAKLCPGLYPTDFLTNHDKWPAGKPRSGDKPARVTARDRAEAQAAGCDVRPQ